MAESSRDRLIQAAAKLFSKHGFGPVGLDRIIAEVGVTKTTFYNHFESKDALVIAVLEYQDRLELEQMKGDVERMAPGNPKEQLLAIFDVFDAWFNESDFRGCMFMAAANEYPDPNDPVHRTAVAHGDHMAGVLRDLASRAGVDDAEGAASQLLIILTGALAIRQFAGTRDAAKSAKGAAVALLDRAGRPREKAGGARR